MKEVRIRLLKSLFKHREELVAKLMQKIRNFCVGSTKKKLRNFVKVAKKKERAIILARNIQTDATP